MIDSPPNSQLVLIVDDEQMVLTLGQVILERKGYRVRVARSGAEAVALCQAPDFRPDCVIIDYTMPEMNGRETLVELRKMLPSIPAIISSGYSDDEILTDMAGITVDGLIHKPYRQDSLIAAIESAFATRNRFPDPS